jgi:hypothetical protein
MPSNAKRIVFTGGSGKAGRHVIPELIKKGYEILNLDLVDFPIPEANVFTLKTDLTNSGEVFNALTTHFNFAGYEGPYVPGPPDAVIHFGAYARNMYVPTGFILICFHLSSTFRILNNLPLLKNLPLTSYPTRKACSRQQMLPRQCNFDLQRHRGRLQARGQEDNHCK